MQTQIELVLASRSSLILFLIIYSPMCVFLRQKSTVKILIVFCNSYTEYKTRNTFCWLKLNLGQGLVTTDQNSEMGLL